jgi:hypothetical protein
MWKELRKLTSRSLRARWRPLLRSLAMHTLGEWLDMVYVVEYPKCGGSWVARMIRTYFGNEDNHTGRLWSRNAVIQSHSLYRRVFRNPIVVVRDPRDVFVSFYYHETHYEGREKNQPIEKYFTHDPERPLRADFAAYLEAKLRHVTTPRFSYSQFLDSWLNRPDTCLVKYEHCLEDAEAQLIRILGFLGRRVDPDRTRYAVEENRFQTRTLVKYGVSRTPGQDDPTKFARKGIAGDWKTHFNESSCMLLETFEGSSLRRLGYEHDPEWIGHFLREMATSHEPSHRP